MPALPHPNRCPSPYNPCSRRLPQKFGSSALTGLSAFAANLKEEAQRNAAAAAAEAALQKQVGWRAWAVCRRSSWHARAFLARLPLHPLHGMQGRFNGCPPKLL